MLKQKDQFSQKLIRTDSDADPRSVLGRSQILRVFIFETLGTFILAFGVACCQYVPPLKDRIPNPFHDIFVSLSLYLAIVIGAPFSGGHFNPAVSFGVYFLDSAKMPRGKLITYIVAQFIGAIIGVTLSKILFSCQLTPYPSPVSPYILLIHSIGEFLGGFLFIFMILTVTNPDTTFIAQPSWIHIFIPLSLFVARSFSYNVGGVNPAVVTMLQMESVLALGISWLAMVEVVVLELFCIGGAIVASWFYQEYYRPTFVKHD